MDEECSHPIRIGNMCGCCGEDMENKNEELFTLLHNNTNVQLNKTEAERVNEEMYDSTTKNKRLVLLLDLDQTVIHTSVSSRFGGYYRKMKECVLLEERIGSRLEKDALRKIEAIKSVNEIKIDGYSYFVKKRDNLQRFLEEVSKYFEIHIYTMGNKAYASAIVKILDETGKIFGNRIVTRDDNFGCFDKDIKRLFPTNSKHVVILDDRPDVWGFVDNLYPIRPYYFFQSEDINSPEALRSNSRREESERVEEIVEDGVEDILERVGEECIAAYFDNELEKVLNGLIDIHREFFNKEQNTANILRRKKNIFHGCVARIFTPMNEFTTYLATLFVHYGGAIGGKFTATDVTHVIIGGIEKVRCKKLENIKYVHAEWMYESVFRLKKQKEEKFLVETYEADHVLDEKDAFEFTDHLEIDTGDQMDELDELCSSDDSLYRQIVDDN
ncbi:RNA polymerase II subunit A C-terminal domain phosphatase [Nematocida minor]|uniref:RNA polymerase II subunit A C-terminal domain phosphatase n=1 Tax=Nematocida minor TaxID=1912983 RepID=UPI00221F9250|nr:RNA polymerase II subunit A C-terminal domain phosphatase [Nematocida minor]KAI5192885.1 RNA polymerase II subunit A C-terminal domain phosphatase [Nematocida minor]